MTTTAILFDVVILLILAGFALHGASRGLLLSLCGLVAVLVAFIGGNFLADLLGPQGGRLPGTQICLRHRIPAGGADAGGPSLLRRRAPRGIC